MITATSQYRAHGGRRQRKPPEHRLAESIPTPASPERRRAPQQPIAGKHAQQHVDASEEGQVLLRNQEEDSNEQNPREAVEGLLGEGPEVIAGVTDD
jgi:hypothetical protein